MKIVVGTRINTVGGGKRATMMVEGIEIEL